MLWPGCRAPCPPCPAALSCSAEFKGASHSSQGWDTIPRFSGGSFLKGRGAGLAAGPGTPAVTPAAGARPRGDNARSRWQD